MGVVAVAAAPESVSWLEKGRFSPLFRHDDDRSASKKVNQRDRVPHLDGLDGRRFLPSPARGRTVPGSRPRHAEGVLGSVALSRSARRRRWRLEAPVAAARRHRRGERARRRGRGLVRLGTVRLGKVGEGLAVPSRRLAAVVRHVFCWERGEGTCANALFC